MEKMIIRTEVWKALDKCRSTDDTREAMKCINITADHAEATDGRMILRLHGAERAYSVSNNATGVFAIVSAAKFGGGLTQVIMEKSDIQFPNTAQVMPKASPEADQIDIVLMDDKHAPTMDISRAIVKLFQHTGSAFTYALLSRLAPMGFTWKASKAEKDHVLRLDVPGKLEAFTAVIMPFQLEKGR